MNDNTKEPGQWLTSAQVAEMLQVDPETVCNWVRTGKLAALKVDRVVRIDRADLAAFLEKYRTKATTEKVRIYPAPGRQRRQ